VPGGFPCATIAVPVPKFIYFDLGNVVLNFSYDRAVEQVAQVSGIDEPTVRRVVFDEGLQTAYETGTVDSAEFHRRFCQATASTVGRDELLTAASDIFTINYPVVPIIAALHSAGYPLGILSNTCAAHWEFITDRRFAIIPLAFRSCTLSYQVGAMKPAPAIYDAATRQAGVSPEEIFFMDDRPSNVAGALAAGWDAVVFESAFQLAGQLADRGVRINF
jgi:putative hydrolase of the HAD superfamily